MTHFIGVPPRLERCRARRRAPPGRGSRRNLEAGDRSIVHGAVDVGGGERAALGRGDPGVEHLVGGPDSDHHGVAVAAGGFEHELGEDAVGLADGSASLIQAR